MKQFNDNRNDNLKLISSWINATNAHDPKLIGETLHTDYEYHFGDSSIKGKQEDLRAWEIFFEAFPDMKFEVEQIISDEEYVAARLRMTGTQKGPFTLVNAENRDEFIPASNKSIDIPMCGFYKIKDGKIIQLIRYWDTASLLSQLGVNI